MWTLIARQTQARSAICGQTLISSCKMTPYTSKRSYSDSNDLFAKEAFIA